MQVDGDVAFTGAPSVVLHVFVQQVVDCSNDSVVWDTGKKSHDVLVGCLQWLRLMLGERRLESFQGFVHIWFWIVIWEAASEHVTNCDSYPPQHGADSAIAEWNDGSGCAELLLFLCQDVRFR